MIILYVIGQNLTAVIFGMVTFCGGKVTQLSRLVNKNLSLTRLNFNFALSKSSLKNEKAYNLRIDASADNGIGTKPSSGLGAVRKIR